MLILSPGTPRHRKIVSVAVQGRPGLSPGVHLCGSTEVVTMTWTHDNILYNFLKNGSQKTLRPQGFFLNVTDGIGLLSG